MSFLVPYTIECGPFLLNHKFADNDCTAKNDQNVMLFFTEVGCRKFDPSITI
jgi:hypothetical protein